MSDDDDDVLTKDQDLSETSGPPKIDTIESSGDRIKAESLPTEQQQAPKSITVEDTERFGEMVILKDEEGTTLAVEQRSNIDDSELNSLKKAIGRKKHEEQKDQKEDDEVLKVSELGNPPIKSLKSKGSLEKMQNLDTTIQTPPLDTSFKSEMSSFREIDIHDDLYEFGNLKKMPFYKRWLYSMERDLYNWYGSFMSLVRHGWGFESFLTLFLGVGSTCFFCYYQTSTGAFLAAKLDFSIIGSAVVFPVTFLIAETFRRREGAIQRLASIKALLCQIELSLLTWRWKNAPDMGNDWEDNVHATLHHIINTMAQILKLPTWNTNRHIYTAQGREFKAKVIKRERELTRRLGYYFSELHWYVEDLKDKGLPANEASRINQYNSLLQIDFEALAMVKSYRTPNVSRSFVRAMVLIMPIFYGPYFSWVSGAIGSGGQTNVAFAIALTIVTVFVLLGLVRVQRAMEDPFTSNFPGDVIDMRSELLDTEMRLNLIVSCSRERKRQMKIQST